MISESVNRNVLYNGGMGKTTNRIWDPVSVDVAKQRDIQSRVKNHVKR